MHLSERNINDLSGNADVLFEDELGRFQRGMLGSAWYDLHRTSEDPYWSARSLEETFARALRTQFFLVVRVDETRKPKAGTVSGRYTEGTLEGDVVVFDLREDPPRVLGSFALSAELTEIVTVLGRADEASVQHALDEALRKTALTQIEKSIGSAPAQP